MNTALKRGEEFSYQFTKFTKAGVQETTSVRSINVVMATRRRPSARGGVERVVTSLVGGLREMRPARRVDAVPASRRDKRIDRIPGLSDVIASLRLGWRLRARTADVIFLHCPECFWGIRLLRGRRRAAPAVVAVWHGAGPRRFLVLRRPGDPLAYALAWLRTIQEVWALWRIFKPQAQRHAHAFGPEFPQRVTQAN
jgi:hypothetical protein